MATKKRPSELTEEELQRENELMCDESDRADRAASGLFVQQMAILDAEEQGSSASGVEAEIDREFREVCPDWPRGPVGPGPEYTTLDGSRDLTDPFVVEIETDAACDDD